MSFPSDSSPVLNTALIEWKETPEAHVYNAHLPGYKRNDVRVEVDDDRVLCIVCGKSVEKEEQRGGWHRVELSSGQFVQRLTLPENSMVDHVKAYMDNGVLTINVPKKHHRGVNNRVRNINISSRPWVLLLYVCASLVSWKNWNLANRYLYKKHGRLNK